MMRLASTLFAMLAIACTFDASAALPPTLSGSWYDAARPGHGLSVEILDDDRAIAYWFAYDDTGAPLHLYIDGRIEGRAIVGDAYAGRGMRFGSFDPREHRLARWGTVRMRFDACDLATLDYDANGPAGGAAFGRGTIALSRLASDAGLACAPNTFPRVEPGVYSGSMSDAQGATRPLHALVDPLGRFWATIEGGGPGVRGEPPRYDAGVRIANAAAGNFAYPDGTPEPDAGSLVLDFGPDGGDTVHASLESVPALAPLRALDARHDAARTATLVRPIDELGLLNRVFAIDSTSGAPVIWIRITYEGFCFEYSALGTACGFRATTARFDAAVESFEFTLYDGRGTRAISHGVGWIEWAGTEPSRIVVVGSGGLGMVGTVLPKP